MLHFFFLSGLSSKSKTKPAEKPKKSDGKPEERKTAINKATSEPSDKATKNPELVKPIQKAKSKPEEQKTAANKATSKPSDKVTKNPDSEKPIEKATSEGKNIIFLFKKKNKSFQVIYDPIQLDSDSFQVRSESIQVRLASFRVTGNRKKKVCMT